jgi:hypothetical protein
MRLLDYMHGNIPQRHDMSARRAMRRINPEFGYAIQFAISEPEYAPGNMFVASADLKKASRRVQRDVPHSGNWNIHDECD